MHLTSSSLNYSTPAPADFGKYARLLMNEDVMKYIAGKALTREKSEQRFQKVLETSRSYPEAGFFIVKSKPGNDFIGVAKLVPFGKNRAEVRYMLLPENWGQGYATEMVNKMINLAREKQLAVELIGIVDPENPASVRVLTKFGFQLYETGQIDGLDASWYRLLLHK